MRPCGSCGYPIEWHQWRVVPTPQGKLTIRQCPLRPARSVSGQPQRYVPDRRQINAARKVEREHRASRQASRRRREERFVAEQAKKREREARAAA